MPINIVYQQGTSREIIFACKDINGAAFNLTGYSAKLWIKRTYDHPIVMKQWSSPSLGLTIPVPTNGEVKWGILFGDLTAISITGEKLKVTYQLEITNGTLTYRPFEGDFIITKEIITA